MGMDPRVLYSYKNLELRYLLVGLCSKHEGKSCFLYDAGSFSDG